MTAERDRGRRHRLQGLGCLHAEDGAVAPARRVFEQALTVGRSQPDALMLLAREFAAVLGNPDTGEALVGCAFLLDPQAPHWSYRVAAHALFFAGRYEDVIGASRRAPAVRSTRLFRTLALAGLDGRAEAEAEIRWFRAEYAAHTTEEATAALRLWPRTNVRLPRWHAAGWV
jgi:hypothetical protein